MVLFFIMNEYIINRRMVSSIKDNVNNEKMPLAEYLIEFVPKVKSGTGLYCHDNSLIYGAKDGNYRYGGLNPNNYVKFNDEIYRVIGIFNNSKNEWQVKIIKDNSNINSNWHDDKLHKYTNAVKEECHDENWQKRQYCYSGCSEYDDQTECGDDCEREYPIKKVCTNKNIGIVYNQNLNPNKCTTKYYNIMNDVSIDLSRAGNDIESCYNICREEGLFTECFDACDAGEKECHIKSSIKEAYGSECIEEDWKYTNLNNNLNDKVLSKITQKNKNIINNINWKTGNINNTSISKNSHDIYIEEMENMDNNFNSSIGLMSLNDYMYAANANYWNTSLSNYSTAKNSNWLSSGFSEWTMIQNSSFELDKAISINTNGSGVWSDKTELKKIRPVFYLKSDVKIIGGNGTKKDPFIINNNSF